MQTQHSITSAILALLALTFAAPSLDAQSPAPMDGYVMPEELAALQMQYSSIPNCMFEYIVHVHPAMDEETRHQRMRFTTVQGMWRSERLDENGLVAEKVYFDGKVYYFYHKRSDSLVILSNPLPKCVGTGCASERYTYRAYAQFSNNPLFTVASMPFLARPASFKIPDLHSPELWKDMMRRSATRHRPAPGTPANQVHFLLDDEALNGILKLEKLDAPGQPTWRVVEHNYLTRARSAHVVTKYEDWRHFPLETGQTANAGAGAMLHMPVLTTITTKMVPKSSVLTLELLPDTITKAPSNLSVNDFRIPRSIVKLQAYVYDITALPDNGLPTETAKAAKPVKPSSRSGQRPKLGGAELKPAPKLRPAPKL